MATTHVTSYLGIDAGGTFTDFVFFDGENWHVHKVLSTPDNPADAILQGMQALGLEPQAATTRVYIIHGSTVATNAALERKGARTVYIANTGLKDVLTIGRQARKQLYTLNPAPQTPPVPAALCLEVDCRRDAAGNVVTALNKQALKQLVAEVTALEPEAIAINLLFSYLADDEERQIEQLLADAYFVSRSSSVLPKYKEYERGMATWLNASLGPKIHQYMQRLQQSLPACQIDIMQSSGGIIDLEHAATRAVNLLLSGPAGGLAAVRQLGNQGGLNKLISFDMGGTSTDVALMNGDFEISDEGQINDWPVAVPILAIETIGAGGGSIAWLDDGGLLHVGPQSAGSVPGPACYNHGGTQPTVTDANLVLGRLPPSRFLGGRMKLDTQQAIRAIKALAEPLAISVEELAQGIIQLAEQKMAHALQGISIKKGHDPADFLLCCFGGAGGLHVCELAELMRMKVAMIPKNSGVLSALGMLTAPRQQHLSQTYFKDWRDVELKELEAAFEQLEASAISSLAQKSHHNEIDSKRSLDLRYKGQGHALAVDYTPEASLAFEKLHQQKYGHTLSSDIELVNINSRLSVESTINIPTFHPEDTTSKPSDWISMPGFNQPVPVYQREDLPSDINISGPAIITEEVSTTWLKPGWQIAMDCYGNLLLKRD